MTVPWTCVSDFRDFFTALLMFEVYYFPFKFADIELQLIVLVPCGFQTGIPDGMFYSSENMEGDRVSYLSVTFKWTKKFCYCATLAVRN